MQPLGKDAMCEQKVFAKLSLKDLDFHVKGNPSKVKL